jgi:hypothetical protein
MNNENISLDRETKIMLLRALRCGYFTRDDIRLLSEKVGLETITVEIIDRSEQVRKTDLTVNTE